MFKIIGLFVIVAVAVASVAAKAEPKPDVIAYSAPVVANAPVASSATFFEQSFHGNFAPVVAAPALAGYPTAYLAPPLAYSYPAYEPFVATAPAAATVLLK
ncbi:cuticle protein 12.5-like [Aedes aegypti]|uniref:Uncharacterized protein n=1 Tax=Aedes aegypti TaxID=7159 RepID=A0A903VPM0_AEDAE|nr:cuticle protein 12.5-like [Aedes aegypti]